MTLEMSNLNSHSFSLEKLNDEICLDLLSSSHQQPNTHRSVTLKDAIIDLYLNVKIRNSEDVSFEMGF